MLAYTTYESNSMQIQTSTDSHPRQRQIGQVVLLVASTDLYVSEPLAIVRLELKHTSE